MSAGVVVLGYGPQPMDFFTKAMKATGKDAVVDLDVARMAGASATRPTVSTPTEPINSSNRPLAADKS